MSNSRLYLILDAAVADYDRLLFVAKESLRGGVDLFQLRDKFGPARRTLCFAQRLRKLIPRKKALLIINDRPDLVMGCEADGVHLGQEDVPVQIVRKFFPRDMLVGFSCQTARHLKLAQSERVDYVGFGSVFKTLTKPERSPMDLRLLVRVVQSASVPLFPIGGITRNDLPRLIAMGVRRVAVCRELCLAKNVYRAAVDIKSMLR